MQPRDAWHRAGTFLPVERAGPVLKVNSRGKHNASLQTSQEAVQLRGQMFRFTGQCVGAVRWQIAWEPRPRGWGWGVPHHLPHLLSVRGSLLPPRATHPHQAIAAIHTACNYFPGGSDGKESACNAGDPGLIPRSGRFPAGGHGNPLQYPCLENPMDRGAWWAAVHGVAKDSDTT